MAFLSSAIVLIAAFIFAVMSGLGCTNSERKWLLGGWLFNLLGSCCFMLILFNVYGSGDLFVYHRQGNLVAELLWSDFAYYAPMTFSLFLQQATPLDLLLFSSQSSTGSMIAVASWLVFFLGDSLIPACLAASMLAFTARVAIYMTFRKELGAKARGMLALACFAVPSAVFWMGGLLKETIACFGMGWFLWGVFAVLMRKKLLSGSVVGAFGALVTLMIKPYIVLPMGMAIGAYVLIRQAKMRGGSMLGLLRPVPLILAACLAFGSILLVGELFPKFSLGKIAEEAARLQSYGNRTNAGSNYQLGSVQATSLSQQAVFLPLALATTLFRPLIFEIHNATAALSGLEVLVAQILLLRAFFKRGVRGTFQMCLEQPVLAYCVVFVLLFSAGVGLGTSNLGTLSRYRVPMMPLYFFLLFMFSSSPTRVVRRVVRRSHKESRPRDPLQRVSSLRRDLLLRSGLLREGLSQRLS